MNEELKIVLKNETKSNDFKKICKVLMKNKKLTKKGMK